MPDSPHTVVISKNPGFRALYLARRNEFRFFSFNKNKTDIFPFLAAAFCPKNIAFARKTTGLLESGAAASQPPGLYAYESEHNQSVILLDFYNDIIHCACNLTLIS